LSLRSEAANREGRKGKKEDIPTRGAEAVEERKGGGEGRKSASKRVKRGREGGEEELVP